MTWCMLVFVGAGILSGTSLSVCSCEWQVQHRKEMRMTNLKGAYLLGCGLRRWRLSSIDGLNPMMNSIYEMREYGVEITLHIGYQFGDVDLCM